jgi:glutamine cyclotransferase
MEKYSKVLAPVFIVLPLIILLLFFMAFTGLLTTRSSNSNNPETPKEYTYEIVNTFDHDSNAFTQGLIYENGFLYEGTGLNGHSSLRKVEMETGKVLQQFNLKDEFFGEGITIFDDKIIQLTYRSNIGFVYDKKTFELLREFNYPREGWGITHDGTYLIMSNGTPTLYFLNPETFEQISRVAVTYKGNLLNNINELEYINGKIYANIWNKDSIVIIDPQTGHVTGVIDLEGLLSTQESQTAEVLNGIAYDQKNKRLLVTGKLWPKLFEIKLVSK